MEKKEKERRKERERGGGREGGGKKEGKREGEKERTDIPNNMGKSQNYYAERKKPNKRST